MSIADMPLVESQRADESLQDYVKRLANLVALLRDELEFVVNGNIDTKNVNRLDAKVIVAGTVTAEKMNVNELSAISANLGSITAGTVTGATIQNQTSAANKVYIDENGLHGNDSSGVERITLGTTPLRGAKAIIGRDSSGSEQSAYTYDTETADGSSRTGQFITAHGAYVLISDDGDIRIVNKLGAGLRVVGANYPEKNDGFGWVPI